MSAPLLVRFLHPEHGTRIGLLRDATVYDLTPHLASIGSFLRHSIKHVQEAIDGLSALADEAAAATYPASLFDNSPAWNVPHWLAPCDEQDIWAAGVTYERSRAARQEEAADGGDVYARVYRAERPELFWKAHGERVVGPYGWVGIRADATWNVPEPELAIVFNPHFEVVGFSIGNDMSSRDIEGANPLYLPQAKVYKHSCALGPGILLNPSSDWPQTTIRIQIERGGAVVFSGEVPTSKIKRSISELADYLSRSNDYPNGVILLTGTGVVPPSDFTLAPDDVVTISIDGLGQISNIVQVV